MSSDVESVEIGSPSLLALPSNTELSIPAALKDLIETSHLFVKKISKELDGKNGFVRAFDVLNSEGIRLYKGLERTPMKFIRTGGGQKRFVVTIFDAEGIELLQFEGELGDHYETFQGYNVWGGVGLHLHRAHHANFPIHFVQNGIVTPTTKKKVSFESDGVGPKTEIVRTIQSGRKDDILVIVGNELEDNCCGCYKLLSNKAKTKRKPDESREFSGGIYLPGDGGLKVGRIGSKWNEDDGIGRELKELGMCYGIKFPKSADLRIKAILLGATFMLDPELFH